MNESDFVALNVHLQEVRPIFDKFCVTHGFTYVESSSLGRYPRIRIERSDVANIWFDLWMGLDDDGRRFKRFSPELPYELSAGAYVDIQDGGTYGTRFQRSMQCFHSKPFDQVVGVLEAEMTKGLVVVEEWNVAYLRTNGLRVQLGV